MANLSKPLSFALVIPLISACTAPYIGSVTERTLIELHLRPEHQLRRQADWRMSRSHRIAVRPLSLSAEGSQLRSRRALNAALETSRVRQFPDSVRLDPELALPHALEASREAGCEILLAAKLSTLKNQLNTVNELREGRLNHPERERGRDTTQVLLLIYDANTGALLDALTLRSRSAVFTWSEDLPMALFSQAIEQAFAALVGSSRS